MISKLNLYSKIVLVSVLYLLGQAVMGGLVYGGMGVHLEGSPGPAEMLWPMLMASFLLVSAMAYPTLKSSLDGRKLFFALFLAIAGINVILTQIEAVVFLVIEANIITANIVSGILNALLLSWLLVHFLRGGGSAAEADRKADVPTRKFASKLLISALVYVVLYFSAGMLIFGQVQDFYATQHIPTGAWLLPLQLARGTAYVLFALMLISSVKGDRRQVAAAIAFMFPMLAGAAGLLAPNAFMPDYVRYWHMLEIGVSNIAYGALVGYLFWNPGSSGANRSSAEMPALS